MDLFSHALGLRRELGIHHGKLEDDLTDHYIADEKANLTLAETPDELNITGPGKEPFRLAVMTDSFSEKLSIGLLDRVRQKFSPENMICLTRDIEEENEKTLRSAGLIFLGSYGTFLAHADNIIKHTLNNGGNKVTKPKTGHAVNRKNTIDETGNYRRNNKKRQICKS
jgi:N-acetylglucosaminyldiphosphoundecaprenol N-acetyl-beta-D-mannosaminyltransferase